MLSVCLLRLSRGNLRASKMSSEEKLKQESLSKSLRVFLLFATIVIINITVVLMLKSHQKSLKILCN